MPSIVALPFTIPIYERGAGGIPSSFQVADLTGIVDRYSHSIKARGGFESCQIDLPVTMERAIEMISSWLMRSTIIFGPDGETLFEGYLHSIEVSIGPVRRSISLDGLGNRVYVRYLDPIGASVVTPVVTLADSIATYGNKDWFQSLSSCSSTAATNIAAAILARRQWPRAISTTSFTTGKPGPIRATLHFSGWYNAFGWVLYSNTDAATSTSTTTQVGNLLTTYNSTNAFFSTATNNIQSSGISDFVFSPIDATFQSKIETLLAQGTSGNVRQSWGIYENRIFYCNPWDGATPTVITYQQRIADGRVLNDGGSPIPPWQMRPDSMLLIQDLLDPSPQSGTADTAAYSFVERVTYTVDRSGWQLRVEPETTNDLDAMLAVLR